MEEKIVDYGTTHHVTVLDANKSVIIVGTGEPANREAFVLMFHGLTILPAEGDTGNIVFERDQNRGHWQYYADHVIPSGFMGQPQINDSTGWKDTHDLMYSRFPEDKRRIILKRS